MDIKKIVPKEKKHEDIIILDNGIDMENTIDTLKLCCSITYMPYRY